MPPCTVGCGEQYSNWVTASWKRESGHGSIVHQENPEVWFHTILLCRTHRAHSLVAWRYCHTLINEWKRVGWFRKCPSSKCFCGLRAGYFCVKNVFVDGAYLDFLGPWCRVELCWYTERDGVFFEVFADKEFVILRIVDRQSLVPSMITVSLIWTSFQKWETYLIPHLMGRNRLLKPWAMQVSAFSMKYHWSQISIIRYKTGILLFFRKAVRKRWKKTCFSYVNLVLGVLDGIASQTTYQAFYSWFT